MELKITDIISIPEEEFEITAIRSSGAGGQNVNKVSTAIHLRFDISQSSLPQQIKERLLSLSSHKISKDGVVVIKTQKFRTREKNREEAQRQLALLLKSVLIPRKKRTPTRPTQAAKKKRLSEKKHRSKIKSARSNPAID